MASSIREKSWSLVAVSTSLPHTTHVTTGGDQMFEVTRDQTNKDIISGDIFASSEYYKRIYGEFPSKFKVPAVEEYGDKFVLRADLTDGGLKAYAAERMISEIEEDTLVYCAPRQGHAADAIAQVARIYGKKVVFFMPSSKKASDHQAALFAYGHCTFKFVRIAAMPVLNKYAREWAEANGARYIPFGMTGTPLVTAGLIKVGQEVTRALQFSPTEFYCAVSTGTMLRALCIAWPNTHARGVAVARNIKKGEIGTADVVSATMPFLTPSKVSKD
ncbi:MAG TPA: pyridoxal-phosphate dependent enzyme, partial [Microbacterium sp.]|nr:pyridoxal-phosphate dependent enzyme [Microbacterium sp.]